MHLGYMWVRLASADQRGGGYGQYATYTASVVCVHLGCSMGVGLASADQGAEGMGNMQLTRCCVHRSIAGPVLCDSTGH